MAKATVILSLAGGCKPVESPKPIHSVIVETPQSVSSEPLKVQPAADPQLAKNSTYLTVSSHDDKVLEARLSVILPDDSLDRVILDPQATFYRLDERYVWNELPGCSSVSECSIPPHKKGATMSFMATYHPQPDEVLLPSFSREFIWVDGQATKTVR